MTNRSFASEQIGGGSGTIKHSGVLASAPRMLLAQSLTGAASDGG
jgi:hypothetical protein